MLLSLLFASALAAPSVFNCADVTTQWYDLSTNTCQDRPTDPGCGPAKNNHLDYWSPYCTCDAGYNWDGDACIKASVGATSFQGGYSDPNCLVSDPSDNSKCLTPVPGHFLNDNGLPIADCGELQQKVGYHCNCIAGSQLTQDGTSCSCPSVLVPSADKKSCVCPNNMVLSGDKCACPSNMVTFPGQTVCIKCGPGLVASASGTDCVPT